jgi:hypothetical protein
MSQMDMEVIKLITQNIKNRHESGRYLTKGTLADRDHLDTHFLTTLKPVNVGRTARISCEYAYSPPA